MPNPKIEPQSRLQNVSKRLERKLAADLLKNAKEKYGQAEVYRVRSESHPISFENNRLKEVMRRDQTGVALRVISGGADRLLIHDEP